MKQLKSTGSVVYNIGYHIVWIPKYRKRILWGIYKNKIQEYLLEKCVKLDVIPEVYEIMPDHIHIFIKCKPNHNISLIVGQLKGYTSFKLRGEFPCLKKYKALWTPSYFCESVGCINEDTVVKYINNQWVNYRK